MLTLERKPGGPLSRGALGAAQLEASARAFVIGGNRVAALVIEIRAGDDDARKATLEVRRVLEHHHPAVALERRASATAQRASEQRALGASLDPRRRIVDLWRGSPPDPPLSRSSLRAFQATLAGAAQVVVSVYAPGLSAFFGPGRMDLPRPDAMLAGGPWQAGKAVLILDYGSQYTQLIARRIRECHVYCEIHPGTIPADAIRKLAPQAIILSGGPQKRLRREFAPKSDPGLFELGLFAACPVSVMASS